MRVRLCLFRIELCPQCMLLAQGGKQSFDSETVLRYAGTKVSTQQTPNKSSFADDAFVPRFLARTEALIPEGTYWLC